MFKIDMTSITAILSVIVGWSLNEVGQWIKSRQEDIKIKKKILYNLLETNFILNQLDTSNISQILSERLILRIPPEEQTEQLKNEIKQLHSTLINDIIKDMVSQNLKSIETKYENAIENLATIDPMTAYRLNGKTKIMDVFDSVQLYYHQAQEQYPFEVEQMDGAIKLTTTFIDNNIIKEAQHGLEAEIKQIAFSISIRTWIKAKRTLKYLKESIKHDDIQKIDELIDNLITNFH